MSYLKPAAAAVKWSSSDAARTRRRVLLIEDDPHIGRLVATELSERNYAVDVVANGANGLALFEGEEFDLLVLDVKLPDLDGLEICRRIRQKNRFVPIVMLTARATRLDIVRGLELGADEYVTKPFATVELMARIAALFRRIAVDHECSEGAHSDSAIRHGTLFISPRKHEVRIDGSLIALTAKEFDLLLLFAQHPARVFSRAELLNAVWGVRFEGYEHTVNTHINRLRNKIEADSSCPRFIETVWGVGYRLGESPS